jgi:hypothetical protein
VSALGSTIAAPGSTVAEPHDQPAAHDPHRRIVRGEQLRRAWQRYRWWVLVAVVALVAVLLGLVGLGRGAPSRLSPDDASPTGARALARVLAQQGVDVRRAKTFDAASQAMRSAGDGGVTLFVARPDLLSPSRVQDLRSLADQAGADLVLADADNGLLADLELPVGARQGGGAPVSDPSCPDPLATRAGAVVTGPVLYIVRGAGTGCFPVGDGFATATVPQRDGTVVRLLGGTALTNDRLADQGDAALATSALGQRPLLVWWTPDPLDGATGTEPASITDLAPSGILWGTAQLVVVLALLVLWRGRRLGRLVPEPLPVVVRAVETTRGRGRLYRKARARDRAAAVLRAATVRRLGQRIGLSRSAQPVEVAVAVARITGRDPATVTPLLVGPDPADDVSLVVLAQDLDDLEEEVHRS